MIHIIYDTPLDGALRSWIFTVAHMQCAITWLYGVHTTGTLLRQCGDQRKDSCSLCWTPGRRSFHSGILCPYNPRPPNVPLLRALRSLLVGIWGILKGGWGVLDHMEI